jgi:hypothetical protein
MTRKKKGDMVDTVIGGPRPKSKFERVSRRRFLAQMKGWSGVLLGATSLGGAMLGAVGGGISAGCSDSRDGPFYVPDRIGRSGLDGQRSSDSDSRVPDARRVQEYSNAYSDYSAYSDYAVYTDYVDYAHDGYSDYYDNVDDVQRGYLDYAAYSD